MIKSTKKRALIIDDEEEIGLLLGYQLKKMGIDSSHATTLGEGLEMFVENNYDLLFLDINLPDGNGLDAIPNLRKANDDTYLVVISAYNTNEYQNRARSLGADKFLGKPFDGMLIKNIVDTVEILRK